MTTTTRLAGIDQLIALRWRVSDQTLVDCLELAQLLTPPCTVTTAELRKRWSCSQPAVSRRLRALWEADLLDYCTSNRAYKIRRIGPTPNDIATM